ncbi:ABC transporter substrate-binding protein [Halococcus sediminicola]|uniref:ABC transporter substrate-binding protein n=1 Tax=Halococcus sediminicola TaxID=1264579 RepID=UPI000678E1B0|nr:ABC transporter substrate-binding protein [Halococcus sediminicola]
MANEHTEQKQSRFNQRVCPISALVQNDQTRRKFLTGLGTAGAAGLAGCASSPGEGSSSSGGGSNNSNGSDSSGNSSSVSGSNDAKTLRMNSVQRFGTIDPAKGTDYTQTLALLNMYDPLVFPNSDGELEPHLASEWTVSDDNLTYTFTIRKGATFHSGESVTAEDVKFTLDRFMDINKGFASLLSNILSKESVTVSDERTVEFTLDQVHSPFLATLVLLFIVDKKTILDNKKDGDYQDRGDYGQSYLNNNDAGSGPYTLDSFERQSSISFAKYDDYWDGWDKNAYEGVEVNIITEDSTVRSLMKNGELDMTSQYQSTETFQALEKMEGVRVETIPTVTLFYMKMNTQKSPTDDPAVRKAISHGFNYETVRSEISPGSKQAIGPLAPSFNAHKSNIKQPTYDPKRARQILSDAGYQEGDLKISQAYIQSNNMEEKVGLLFQENMNEIGIDVELNPQTWGTITELATSVKKTPHVNQVFYGPVYPSPDTVFYNQYHSEAASSWISMSHLENDKVDSMIEEARQTVDADARAEIYGKLQNKLVELAPDIFGFVQAKKHGFAKSVQGYTYRPSQSYDYWFHNYHHQ